MGSCSTPSAQSKALLFLHPKSRQLDITVLTLFTVALETLVLQTIHDGSTLVAKGAARLVGVVDPSMRFLVLKGRRKQTGTITGGMHTFIGRRRLKEGQ